MKMPILLPALLLLCMFPVKSLRAVEASDVQVGLRIDQITGNDQKQENFSAVISLRID